MVHVRIVKDRTQTVRISPIQKDSVKVGIKSAVNYIYDLDYTDLKNKPSINDVELVGNKTSEDIGISTISNSQISKLIDYIFKE